jgi:crossover junction endodeoxyribonuclease RusA
LIIFSAKLPLPPSVNHYYRRIRKGVIISAKGREYRQQVKELVGDMLPLVELLSIEIDVTFPDRRRRDIDNLLKSLLDCLQYAGVYKDDSQIKKLTIEEKMIDKESSGVYVRIKTR